MGMVVDQSDREAAISLLMEQRYGDEPSPQLIRETLSGERDPSVTVQAFARHRLTSQPSCEPMEPDEEGWSEWIHPLPGYLMQCCDCGLSHEMEVAITEAGDGEPTFNEGESEASVVIFRMRRAAGPHINSIMGEGK